MAYTEEQIQKVCEKAADVMKDFTDVQNCTFPSTAIIAGMKAGLSAEEIACNAYDTISKLPLHQTGFGLVGTGDSMKNVALYMQGAILRAIEEIDKENAVTPTPSKPPVEQPVNQEDK